MGAQLRQSIGGRLLDVIAGHQCVLHDAGRPTGPVRRVAFRRTTELPGEVLVGEEETTRCDREVPRLAARSPVVLTFGVRAERVDSLDGYAEVTMISQINDGTLDGDEATWSFRPSLGWRLVRYRRGGVDNNMRASQSEPLLPLPPLQRPRPPAPR